MNGHDSLNKASIYLLLLTFTAGCTTSLPLAPITPEALADLVAVGDTVEVEKKDGDSLTLNVTEVSKEGVRGSGNFVPYTDIQRISLRRENVVGTVSLVVLGVAVLYALEKNFDCGLFSWDSECSQ